MALAPGGCATEDAASQGDDQTADATDETAGEETSASSQDDSNQDETGEASSDEDTGSSPVEPLPVDESAPLVGRFLLTLQAEKGGNPPVASFTGNVGDAVYPELTIWDQADEDSASGCELLVPRVPDCGAGCGADACVEEDTCAPYPTRKSIGEVTIDGVHTTDGASSITIKPQMPRLDYIKGGSIVLEYPPFSEGEAVTLFSAGGEFTPLSIGITGIAPLDLVGAGTKLAMSSDEPLALQWTAAAAGDSFIQIKVDISHHGGAKGKIECQTEDDGSVEIPAKLTKALIELGVAGYPTVEVTRVSRGVGNIELGLVEFQTISMRDRELEIPGLTSCMSDEDCPDGQVCKVTRSCG